MIRPRALMAFLSASVLISLASAQAQTPVQLIDQVQEDWKLVVRAPDTVGVGPQITTCMSPVSDKSSPFVAFDLNYREYPSFQAGGMQLQVWSGGSVLSTSSQGSNQFSTVNETVTWTQQMSISAGTLTYGIANGRSTTWGRFGQGYGLLNVTFPTTITDLSLTYSPDVSAANSGASWEANYVTSMTLIQVRYYSNGQLIATDSTPRSVSLTH